MSMPTHSYSLYELLASVRRCIEASYVSYYWVRAETSGVNLNSRSGHCYLELEEKGDKHGYKARIRANIWRDAYERIARKFRDAGLQPLSSGMNILCLAQLSFHEQYGLSIVIHDIDADYSLGEIARQRQETIKRLQAEGIFDANKGLTLPRPLQRLAIISSPTAAGYGDFVHQLHNNPYGLKFYTALFVAQMQGEGTTKSIISALDRLSEHLDNFDAVVIIRGGGAVSELRVFDDYALSYYCTQFPLPIISGIGHDRDTSVLDMVAHTSLKTPTAVAEFLVQGLLSELKRLDSLQQAFVQSTYLHQSEAEKRLQMISLRLPHATSRLLQREGSRQSFLQQQLSHLIKTRLEMAKQQIERRTTLLPYLLRNYIQQRTESVALHSQRLQAPIAKHQARYRLQIDAYEQIIRISHPSNILQRGFALVERGGEILTARSQVKIGDHLSIRLGTQTIQTEVKELKP